MEERRSKRYRSFVKRHPYCCYCGGTKATAEIDHAPPKNMFLGKARPDDFVFPACSDCNRRSSLSETVSTILFQAKPFDERYASEVNFVEVLRAVTRNAPDVIQEMFYSETRLVHKKLKLKREIGRSDFDLLSLGPVSRTYLYNFCAKMGLAAHYRRTGAIVPSTGIVISDVRIGPEFLTGNLPSIEISAAEIGTLKQGKWEVWDQFAYRSAETEAPHFGLYQFIFHNNVLITCFVYVDRQLLGAPYDDEQARFPGAVFRSAPSFTRSMIPKNIEGSFLPLIRVRVE